jgi:hypothetical protein
VTDVRDWVSPVDWNTADYDWNGNPQLGTGLLFLPVSATVTQVRVALTATVTVLPAPTAAVTKVPSLTATVVRTDL